MGRGIKVRAWDPLDRMHIFALGNEYNDTGPAKFLLLKLKSFLIKQGFNNNDDPNNKIPFDIDFYVKGKNFKYTLGVPTSGDVKKIIIEVNGEPAYKFSKLDLPVQKLLKWYLSDDPFGKLSKLLKGDDKIIGSQFDDPDIFGGRGDDELLGKDGNDTLDGFKGNDLSDGGFGNDYLKDTKGQNTFQFSTMLHATENVDTIKMLGKGDLIYLSSLIFPEIGNKLNKNEFGINDLFGDYYVKWDSGTNTGYYDRDGAGGMAPIPFFRTENDANVTHKSFVVGTLLDY